MRGIEVDARRYAWCHGRALWLLGLQSSQLLEDLEGAAAAGQPGLVQYSARWIGGECAVMLALVTHHGKPIPSPSMRAAWALDLIEGHELWPECWWALRGIDDETPADEVVARCTRLVDRVREVVGDVPNPLTPEGYHPALALARDWLKLSEALREESFLPEEWTKGAD